MSLLQHYNTIKLTMTTDRQAVMISDLIGFKLSKKDQQGLFNLKQCFVFNDPDNISSKCFNVDKVRAQITTTVNHRKQTYSRTELESLADQFLNPEASEPPTNSWRAEVASIYHKANTLQQDYKLVLSIAAQLISAQQQYLCSRNWMEKKKNTFLEVATHHPQCSEATVRRRVKAMRFSLDGWKFSASNLICSNNLPLLCKHISRLNKNHPNAGRPTLYRLLSNEGYDFSERNIGNAIKLLDMAKFYGDEHEFF